MVDNFTTEKELVQRVICGDQYAFKEIFHRYKDKLFSYCFRFTKSEPIAEEIVQDVLLKIWVDRERINPELSFCSYLYTITKNYSLNFLKKAAADAAMKERLCCYFEEFHCEPETQLIYKDIVRIANEAVALLPPQRRRIYEMSRGQAMNYEEIAICLGISKNTVKNQLVQALKAIRQYLIANTEMGLYLTLLLLVSIF